ncbi:Long-chain-alcohol O-fatty-acyltransferase [Vitis vinifera]|uniref:Long-chain-alcohol O-fatty-acyltransferase n=1 Tax=Vitis vinifera TaxID=29760 RepID=A0A438GDD9_VITVI|nr:Long-chain-alcohol O-fatty-acyltransferase [Vitis vinifera]
MDLSHSIFLLLLLHLSLHPQRPLQTPLSPPHHSPLHHPPSPPLRLPPLRPHRLLACLARQLQTSPLLLRPWPLSPPQPLLHLYLHCLLPIKISQNPYPNSYKITSPYSKTGQKVAFLIKALALAALLKVYKYRQFLHPNVILALYCCHVYLAAELILALAAAPARAIGPGARATSSMNPTSQLLYRISGGRWNLMVSSILRPTIYFPIRGFTASRLGPRCSHLLAMLAAFTVSGLMHEVIYYYLTRVTPTWEVTWFFVLQGVCTAAEVAAKKAAAGRWQLPPAVTRPLTVVFVAATGFWLFFPQLLRNHVDVKTIGEYSILLDFVKEKTLLPLSLYLQ